MAAFKSSHGYKMHFKRQPQIELLNWLIYYQICNSSEKFHKKFLKNFLVPWGYKFAWILHMEKEDLKKTKHMK